MQKFYLQRLVQVGEKAILLKGKYKGSVATVKAVNRDQYNCDLEMFGEDGSTIHLTSIEYEDFSKAARQ